MVFKLPEIALIADTDIGTMLIDNHEATLDGGHDVTALVLVMERRWIELRIKITKIPRGNAFARGK